MYSCFPLLARKALLRKRNFTATSVEQCLHSKQEKIHEDGEQRNHGTTSKDLVEIQIVDANEDQIAQSSIADQRSQRSNANTGNCRDTNSGNDYRQGPWQRQTPGKVLSDQAPC